MEVVQQIKLRKPEAEGCGLLHVDSLDVGDEFDDVRNSIADCYLCESLRAAISPPKVVVGILIDRNPGEMAPERVILLSDRSGIEAAEFDPRSVALDELGWVRWH
jgi:hypothetical protein